MKAMKHKMKKGGKVHHKEEHEAKEEKHHYKKGGAVKKHKKEHKVEGKKAHHRMDKKARGGEVGANSHPLSSANRVTMRPGFAASKADESDD